MLVRGIAIMADMNFDIVAVMRSEGDQRILIDAAKFIGNFDQRALNQPGEEPALGIYEQAAKRAEQIRRLWKNDRLSKAVWNASQLERVIFAPRLDAQGEVVCKDFLNEAIYVIASESQCVEFDNVGEASRVAEEWMETGEAVFGPFELQTTLQLK